MLKEKKEFEAQRPDIEKSIVDYAYKIVREDLLLRALHKLKLDGRRKGADKVEFLGGVFTRKGGEEGSEYEYKGKDENLLNKIQSKYAKEQVDQDRKKLVALSKYFVAGETALRTAIRVRDKGSDKKLVKAGSEKLKPAKILAFNQLPGLTCPGKGECFNWCFALSGMTAMPTQMNAYAENLGAAERDDFVDKVDGQLSRMKASPIHFNGEEFKKILRIHAYGDFHTPKYVEKWREIARRHPEVFFYAYTKSFYMKPMKEWMSEIKSGKIKNVKIIQSFGSKFDSKIDMSEPHVKVFDSLDALKKAGYIHCDSDDAVAANPKNKKIGIVKHGSTPCAAGFCPYEKTTASYKGSGEELPLIHTVDQIDMPHHMAASDLSSLEDLGAHLTSSEHLKGFGRHMKKARFKAKVLDKYKVSKV
jgi:hypothetical protein